MVGYIIAVRMLVRACCLRLAGWEPQGQGRWAKVVWLTWQPFGDVTKAVGCVNSERWCANSERCVRIVAVTVLIRTKWLGRLFRTQVRYELQVLERPNYVAATVDFKRYVR